MKPAPSPQKTTPVILTPANNSEVDGARVTLSSAPSSTLGIYVLDGIENGTTKSNESDPMNTPLRMTQNLVEEPDQKLKRESTKFAPSSAMKVVNLKGSSEPIV